jgi:hypothetical protein
LAGVFLSYRRQDSSGWAGNLSRALIGRFGKDKVFFDIATLQPGVEYKEVIEQWMAQVDVILILIGPRWLTITDDTGQRRLDDPKDLVRIEVAAALKRDVPVVPVLVGGAAMPAAAELPEELQELADRNGYELTDRRWDIDQKELIKYLSTIVVTRRFRLTPARIAALCVLLLAIGTSLYYMVPFPWLAQFATRDLLKELEEQQRLYQSYLESIGFKHLRDDTVEIAVISRSEGLPVGAPVGTDQNMPSAFYYMNKIFIHEDLLKVPAAALTSYTHHALLATLEPPKRTTTRNEIEAALAVYYPSSFFDFPKAIPWIDLDSDNTYRPIPSDNDGSSTAGKVFAEAFWSCRSLLGQDAVDRVLLMAWVRSGSAEEAVSAFNLALKDVAEGAEPNKVVECIFDEFGRRGAPLVE